MMKMETVFALNHGTAVADETHRKCTGVPNMSLICCETSCIKNYFNLQTIK
jgi:hypothetical protein